MCICVCVREKICFTIKQSNKVKNIKYDYDIFLNKYVGNKIFKIIHIYFLCQLWQHGVRKMTAVGYRDYRQPLCFSPKVFRTA